MTKRITDFLRNDRKSTGKPDDLPDEFWDEAEEAPRLQELVAAYLALRQRLSDMVRVPGEDSPPEDIEAFRRALGVPETPEGYDIAVAEEVLAPDPEVNHRLLEAGFTPAQAQLVYDLAAERVLPMVRALAADYEAERQRERLVAHFGGEDRWAEVSRQLLAWGRKALPEDTLAALGGTFEGVLALHQMMRADEPAFAGGEAVRGVEDEAALKALMRKPGYWRRRDPALVARVSEGFRRLYPESAGPA